MNAIERNRKKVGKTQAELADELGVTQGNISQWENGIAFPRMNKLPELAKALDCSIDELFSENERPA